MSISRWLRTPRIRRGMAVGAVILSAGGLVLLRAPTSAQGSAFTLGSGKNAAEFRGPGLHGSLALTHGKVLAGSTFALYGDLRLTADVAERAQQRAPIAMAIVLDTSGSMSGEKIEEAKRSVVKLVRDMRDDDEIAFIRYSDGSETIQALTRVGNVREGLIRRVEAIEAGGGTNIPSGIRRGRDALAEAAAGRVRRIVLVSDGLDSSRRESERLATDAAESGVTTSSLGIGLDFDESYMSGVATVGHGNFGFVKDGAALAKFLQKELTETASTTVVNTNVRVHVPAGMRFVRATGADARVDDAGHEVTIRVGSLFAGDERRVLLEFASMLEDGEARTVDATASWDRIGGTHAEVKVAPLSFVATSDKSAVDASRDPEAWARAASVIATRQQIEATEAYARGDKTRGDALIQSNGLALRAAAAAAPAKAPELNAQWQTYEADKRALGSGGAGARPAAKAVMEREFGNANRKSTY